MKYISLILLCIVSSLAAEDFEYSTAGTLGTPAQGGGACTNWGTCNVATVYNDTGHDLYLSQIAFPCSGPPSGPYGWVVWTDVGGINSPVDGPTTAEYYGPYTPADPDPTDPPDTYTFVDISAAGVVIPDGNYFCFGYENTGFCGLVVYTGVYTWSWWDPYWEEDEFFDVTSLLEVYANFSSPIYRSTWGQIKSDF